MSNFDRFGQGGFRKFGRGQTIPDSFPTLTPLDFVDFSGGFDISKSPETIGRNATPYALDMEVTERNRIVRLPGLTTVEGFDPRTPSQVALHASLDNRSELVFFDPPFIGVKGAGATVWSDIGLLMGRRVAWVNFGGTLIFGNRAGQVFYRQASSSTVETSDVIPRAAAYASFAGRVFGGGAVIAGNLEPMGMVWSAANSNYLDWESLGAGDELLINDMSSGDRVVSLKTMGLDFMAVLMRRSIWIGRRTGLVARPADFQPRVAGIGAVNPDVVKSTLFGVIFLHDTGVYIFDGNTSHLVSAQINAELLPLVDAGAAYSSVYDPARQRYYLMTPEKTYVYDLLRKRWYPSSMVGVGGTIFAEQFEAERWNTVGGTWADVTETWAEMSPQESDQLQVMVLGDEGGVRTLAEFDDAATGYFGVDQTPRWEFPRAHHPLYNRQLTIQQLNLEYAGEGTVEVWTPDVNGDMTVQRTVDLPATTETRVVPVHLVTTGRGAGCQIRNIVGRVEIVSAQLMVRRRGARIEGV